MGQMWVDARGVGGGSRAEKRSREITVSEVHSSWKGHQEAPGLRPAAPGSSSEDVSP